MSEKKKATFGLLCALPEEGKALLPFFKNITKKTFYQKKVYTGMLPDKQSVALVLSGMGKVQAAAASQLLISEFSPDFILNFGIAGALAPFLEIGDIVLSQQAVAYDYYSPYGKQSFIQAAPVFVQAASRLQSCRVGLIASGDQNVDDQEKKEQLWQQYQALCCDWETAAVLQVAREAQTAAASLRVISDTAEGGTDQVVTACKKNLIKVLPPAAEQAIFLLQNLL